MIRIGKGPKEGWGRPWWSPRWWHFFRDGKALCDAGGWSVLYGKLIPNILAVADNDCRACLKIIDEEAKR